MGNARTLIHKPRQAKNLNKFALLILEGWNPLDAAREVQLGRPAEDVMAEPGFAEAVLGAMARKLTGDMLPIALKTLTKLMLSDDERIQLGATKAVIQMVVPPNALREHKSTGGEALESLSAQELADMIERLEQAKASKAQDVSPGANDSVSPQLDAIEQPNPLMQFG